MTAFIAYLAGILFAVGLGISGMTQPSKVLAFLDFAGEWDPSLVFVMVGAIGVYSIAYLFSKRSSAPLLSTQYHLPTSTQIDRPLVLGATIFGVGWGLSGICPGPALVAATTLNTQFLVFVGSMVGGMLIGLQWAKAPRASSSPSS